MRSSFAGVGLFNHGMIWVADWLKGLLEKFYQTPLLGGLGYQWPGFKISSFEILPRANQLIQMHIRVDSHMPFCLLGCDDDTIEGHSTHGDE